MNINFIPEWYLENNNKKIIKIYSIILVMFLAINLLTFNKMICNLKNITRLKQQIYNINLKNNKKVNIITKKDKNYIIFQSIYKCFNKDIIVDNLSIKDGKITLEARCSNLDKYYKLLDSLENNNKISIKNLSAPQKQESSNLKSKDNIIDSSTKDKEEVIDSTAKDKEEIMDSEFKKEENLTYKFKFTLE